MTQWVVKRHGKTLERGFESPIAAMGWLHSRVSFSVDWAVRYEGYSIEQQAPCEQEPEGTERPPQGDC